MKKATGKSNLSIVRDYVDGTRPFIQVGYVGDSTDRKDGEIWEDSSGKKWIKKNGYKRAINNVSSNLIDSVKQVCKDCNMEIKWGSKYDQKFFNKTGRCYDCLIKYESHLVAKGLFKDYEKRKVLSNKLSVAREFKEKVEESLKYTEKTDQLTFPNGDGTFDIWTVEKKSGLINDLKKDLKKVKKLIIQIESELKGLPNVGE
jgi:hypothetical protein